MRRFVPPVPRLSTFVFCLLLLLTWVTTPSAQQSPRPIADPNVNMVRGITFPTGDPYLQRQNEPSIAVSTRNPCHLLAGANDYRAVDIPFDDTPPPNEESNMRLAGDAWLGIFKSFDCGQKWSSTLLPGFPQDNSGLAPSLSGYAAGADPTVRAGSNGLFYYSGMVFNRGDQGDSKIFVARLIDNNNIERGDPIQFIDVATIDTGVKGQFLDKPWLAVDIPRNSYGPGSTLTSGGGGATCEVAGQTIPAGRAYMAWARFTGEDGHSKLMFARSTDCGKTWKSHPMSNNQQVSQGANIAIAPHDGTVYLTWREFASGGTTVSMWIAVSSDGGETFSAPTQIAPNVNSFDQIRTNTKFRSNALPAITADHENRVYVAWAETGYGSAIGADGTLEPNSDARIVMAVSSNRGQTFGTRFPIDPITVRGHQMMPSLAFAAGKIQAIYYDSREDVSGVHRQFIDDKDIPEGSLRHTIDVRGVQADPAAQPVFVAAGLPSLEISKYRQWNIEKKDANGNVIGHESKEIGANPPNLPMYAAGTTPFMGDYIDVSGLTAFPIQTASGQVWQPNIGPINLMGASASSVISSGFPTLPIFHAVWTDNRDVRSVAGQCAVPPDPSATGERNANIYTSRLTPGLFVGSPGNTKPLGFRIDKETGQPTTELIQRGFVVFAQNTTDTLRFFEFNITNQPAGGKATFRQFEKAGQPVLSKIIVSIPAGSTVARTVYATSTDVNAQVLVNVQEMTPIEIPGSAGLGQPNPLLKKQYEWLPAISALRASILLNPDRTNPAILDPDIDGEVPEIASAEVHNPSMFDAQFFKHRAGSTSRQLDVRNPDPENPDPENPDPENPDPENPDPENPDPENPDPENPDPENPDPENPDPENPDPENSGVLNTAISEAEVQNSTITDINWRVHNSGNTTSAYNFRPMLQQTGAKTKYQLIVTRRYMTLAMDPQTCKPIYKSHNQVVVNIVNFDPKAPDPENPDPENPDPENPDPENPDPENPDPENPDPENPDPENPDPENPDPENANFFLAPEETATVTLRSFTPPDEEPPTSDDKDRIAAKAAAQKANTGETKVSTAVAGPDLTLLEEPFVAPPTGRSGQTINVTWTLTNRGTAAAVSPTGTIKTNVYFSNDGVLSEDDVKIGNTVLEPSPFAFCPVGTTNAACTTTTTTPVTLPAAPGQYFVIVVTDDDNDADDENDEGPDPDREVFEADEKNNALAIPVRVDAYQLAFVQQPSATTQDFTITPPVTVVVTHPDGLGVTANDVPVITVSIQNNPSAGTLSGAVVQANGGGMATFADLRIDQPGIGYTLSATALFSTAAFSAPFTIEVDAPPVAVNDNYSVNEDAVLTVVAPGVLGNDSDPPTKGGQPEGYGLTAMDQTEPTNGSVQFNNDGSFTYTPQQHFNGTNSFTYAARDGHPGNNTTGTVTITIVAVNDAPSFATNDNPNQTVNEDSGSHTVANWAMNISAGPADESGQALNFVVTNNSNGLFSVQPELSPTGTLTFTPAPDASGVATVSVTLHDSGGTANGGDDTSETRIFTITVSGANDGPVAQADNYTTREDTALGVDASGIGGVQGLLFNDVDPDTGTNGGLIAEYLTTTTNGTLLPHQNGSFSYTPNANFHGTDSFTYRAFDGITTGNTVTVTITVLPVNDVPGFTKGEDQTVPMNATTQVFAWASQISAGPANEAAQALDFIVTNDNPLLFSEQPAVAPDGTLMFSPRNSREGTATITVRVHDDGGTANGGVDTSAPQTFVITVTSAVQNYVVTNTNDTGKGSLRAALINANANDSHDVISFNIGNGGVRTITPLTPLPAIVFPVTINGWSQPGYAGTPLVELNGASAGANANGFTVQSNNVTIRGFVINRFSNNGITINGSNNVVAGNYIGTNAGGTAALANGQDGVLLFGAPNLVGGSAAAERNVISGNVRHGVIVANTAAHGNAVRGNYIGTNAAGTAAIGNGNAGVWVEQSGTVLIGGSLPGEGNVISGNVSNGVHFYICSPGVPCAGAVVQANKIGTNVAGSAAIPNRRHGIEVTNSPNHVMRGNLISGNGSVADNLTGHGIAINVPTPAEDPLAEQNYGNHTIAGNLIGTNAAGSAAIPNTRFGISLTGSTKARIGGLTPADRNVISFNGDTGVFLGYGRTFNNTVLGNYIGVNAAGTQSAGNLGSGIYIANGSSGNVIGGNFAGAGNVIGGNAHNGVSIVDTSNNNLIAGNFIGLSADGTVAFGNQVNGISLDGTNNTVASNQIANNTTSGVIVNANGTLNQIAQNSIHSNGLLGIDLMPAGVTPNDQGDGDAGANNLQNFPVLTVAFVNGIGTTIAGTINTTPLTQVTIELFSNQAADPSGHGEGRNFLGTATVVTDESGNASFNTGVPAVPVGAFITATATAIGGTSEFSLARAVVDNTAPTATNDSASVVSGQTVTLLPATNDSDPDVSAPQVTGSYNALAGLHPLTSPGDVAIVQSTGRGYFTGGDLSAATRGSIGVLDVATSTVTGTIPKPVQGVSTLHKVNQTTQIVYMRIGSSVVAIDGRPASPTFNQVILTLNMAAIQSMAIDESRSRLYVGSAASNPTSVTVSLVSVIDLDPLSATFHEVIQEITMPSGATILGLAVNTATNRIYAAAAGVTVINGDTWAVQQVPNSPSTAGVVVNQSDNVIYATSGPNLIAIDGATNTIIETVPLAANATGGQSDSRLVIHPLTARVYVRLNEFPNPGRLVIVDGRRTSETFNDIVATLTLGRENGNAMLALNPVIDRLVVTSPIDFRIDVINSNNANVATYNLSHPANRVSIDLSSHRAFVTGSVGSLFAFSTDAAAPPTSIQTGAELFGVAVNPVTHTAYVGQTDTGARLRMVGENGAPTNIALPHTAGRSLYVARNSTTNRVYMLNGQSNAGGTSDALPGFVNVLDGNTNMHLASVPVGPVPFGMAVNEVANKIYVGNGSMGQLFTGGISVIDGVTHAVTQADISLIPQNSTTPGQIQVGRDIEPNTATGKVYFRILSGSPTQLGVLSAANVATAFPGFTAVNTIRVNPVLNRIYVGNTEAGANLIHVFDGANDQEIATIFAGSPTNFITNQSYLAINRTTGRLFAADFNQDIVSVIDGNTNLVTAQIRVGDGPSTVAVNHALNRIYVGNAIDRTLSIIDGNTSRVVRTVPLPIAPVQLHVDESSPARIFISSTAIEARIVVVTDTGTAAPQLTSVSYGGTNNVTLNADGSVSYQALNGFSGNESFTYTIADGNGGTTTGTVNIAVASPIGILPAALPATTVNAPYSQTLGATGGTGPYTWTATSVLPPGLTFDTNGAITGSVRSAGTYNVTVQVRDSATPPQVVTAAYTLVVGPPVIITTFLPNAFENAPYSQQLQIGGATGAVQWTINKNNNPLLDWLSIANDGTLSGTAPEAGSTPSFTVTATDAAAQVATRALSLFVSGPLDISPLREGVVLETPPSLSFIGGSGARTMTVVDGTLPPGVSLSSTGLFSGSPMRHGEYPFTLELKECQPIQVNGLPTCNNQITPQTVTKQLVWRVSARDQQGTNNGTPIGFGGPGGRKLAQVVTVGAQGTLTAVGTPGTQGFTCPAVTPLTVAVQRLTLDGLPDGNTIASGTQSANYNLIALAPPVALPIGARVAIIFSSPVACTFNNVPVTDSYQGGDAYADSGSGWVPLFDTDGRYDLSAFRTLIQPALDVAYLNRSRGSMVTATVLNSGKVLVAGNSIQPETYDPGTHSFALTANAMSATRNQASATLLADGRVLVVGGSSGNVRFATAEIYDPATGLFTTLASQLATGRERHRAVRLADGRVLITGGTGENGARLQSAEIFDPATEQFSSAGNMLAFREQHVMTLVAGGKVLIAGGYTSGGASAEIFNPATGQFTATTGAMIVSNRGQATATLLNNGKVLIAGGQFGDVRAEAELYDPITDSFAATGSLSHKRFVHAATLLGDGSVLIAGGFDQQNGQSYIQPLATLERYMPGSGTFVSAGAMETGRQGSAAVTLADGRALIVAGFSASWMANNTAELFDPSTALTIAPTTLPDGMPGVEYPGVTLTASGGTAPHQITHVSGVLPPGLAYAEASQALNGTPAAGSTGLYPLGFEASDAAANKVVQSFALRIGNVTTITSPYRLIDGALNAQYEVQLMSTGQAPVVWSLAPASSPLPNGLTLGAAGAITGVPTQTGFFNVTVRATGNDGQQAIKVLSISVNSPLTINTTSLANVDLFSSGPGCLSVSNGVGTRTYDIAVGALPGGLTIGPLSSCFSGTVRETGEFNFTVRVTDQSSPPQVATRAYTVRSYVADQSSFGNSSQPPLDFGGTIRLAERVLTGVTGTLHAVRLNNLTCPANTTVLVEIQGLAANGAPDGNTIAAGKGVTPLLNGSVELGPGEFFAADAQFALVVSADQVCSIRPNNFDSYPGTGYVATNINNWQTQLSVDGRDDITFTTLISPEPGLLQLSTWRGDHAESVLLPSGKVLLIGGNSSNTVDVFDPAFNSITQVMNLQANPVVPATLNSRRAGHTATALDANRVLIAGGTDQMTNTRLASAEIFDLQSGTSTAVGPMSLARADHTATLLQDGKILIAGGRAQDQSFIQQAELFDPNSNTFLPLGNMIGSRYDHTATRLNDGRVLLAGGWGNGARGELFDPGSQTFSQTDGSMIIPRGRHTATLLNDGTVLIAGGTGNSEAQASTEIFNPDTSANGAFTPGANMFHRRDDFTATRLADGSVLMAGGIQDTTCCYPHPPQASLERFVPGTGFFHAGSMQVARYRHTATALIDGRVLLAGTWGWSSASGRFAELYNAATTPYITSSQNVTGTSGTPFTHILQPDGGAGGPYSIGHLSGALPPGLSFNAATFTISGTPTQPGTFTFTVSVTDGNSNTGYQTITIGIDTVEIATASLPTAHTGVAYASGLAGSGVGDIVKWEIISGGLPNGLSLDQVTGAITGTTPSSCCTYFFTVRATDSIGQTAIKTISINVQQPLNITTTSLYEGWAGGTYGACISASGGSGAKFFAITGGTTPAGLSLLSSGCFDWTWPNQIIREGGTFTFTVTATDQSVPPQTDTQTYTVSFTANDQTPGSETTAPVQIPVGMKIAQVYTSSTPFPLSGVDIFSLSCPANTTFTVDLRRVIGAPPRPDETGAPLASANVSTAQNGFFDSRINFGGVPMPPGSQFAIVLHSFTNACSGQNWSVNDNYRRGQAWTSNGAGWAPAITTIGRHDLPFYTRVAPGGDLRFLAGWRGGHAAATLANGNVLTVGTDEYLEIFDPSANSLTLVPTPMAISRFRPTATTLNNNKVLIAGGEYWDYEEEKWKATATTLLYDPANGSLTPGPTMPGGRFGHEATLLSDGRVLISGGWDIGPNGFFVTLDSALLFDANATAFTPLTMTGARVQHTVTEIGDGRVVIIGGWTGNPWPATTAEVYDPAEGPNGTFSPLNTLFPEWPSQHTATLLTTGPRTGQILIAGGSGSTYPDLNPVVRFLNPDDWSLTAGPALNVARFDHAATVLPDGNVAFTGGIADWYNYEATTVIELFDATTDGVSIVGDLVVARYGHAVNTYGTGYQLAVSGGWGSSSLTGNTVERFDVAGGGLTITTASLPNGTTTGAYLAGTLIAAGGSPGYLFSLAWGALPPGLSLSPEGEITGTPTAGGLYRFSVKVTDSASDVAYRQLSIAVDKLTFSSPATLPQGVAGAQYSHQLEAAGSGSIAFTLEPGYSLPGTITLSPTGLISGTAPPQDWYAGFLVRATDASGQIAVKNFSIVFTTFAQFFAMNPMSIGRRSHIAVELETGPESGSVLLAGSETGSVTSSELYDPATQTTTATGDLNVARCYGCASAKLDDGTVLAAGGSVNGQTPVLGSAETYDPQTGVWTPTAGNLVVARLGASAIKLNSGLVLILGGHDGSNEHASAELYNPATRTFSATGSMNVARTGGAVALLADGRVLVVGGQTTGHVLTNTAEIYNPANGTFSFTADNMSVGRQPDAAITLPDGRVLVVGGPFAAPTNYAELFDPVTEQFNNTGPMTARSGSAVVLLPYGKVLVMGGLNAMGNATAVVERFNPSANNFEGVNWLTAPRVYGNAVLLRNGHVLITGGSSDNVQFLSTVERYSPQ